MAGGSPTAPFARQPSIDKICIALPSFMLESQFRRFPPEEGFLTSIFGTGEPESAKRLREVESADRLCRIFGGRKTRIDVAVASALMLMHSPGEYSPTAIMAARLARKLQQYRKRLRGHLAPAPDETVEACVLRGSISNQHIVPAVGGVVSEEDKEFVRDWGLGGKNAVDECNRHGFVYIPVDRVTSSRFSRTPEGRLVERAQALMAEVAEMDLDESNPMGNGVDWGDPVIAALKRSIQRAQRVAESVDPEGAASEVSESLPPSVSPTPSVSSMASSDPTESPAAASASESEPGMGSDRLSDSDSDDGGGGGARDMSTGSRSRGLSFSSPPPSPPPRPVSEMSDLEKYDFFRKRASQIAGKMREMRGRGLGGQSQLNYQVLASKLTRLRGRIAQLERRL